MFARRITAAFCLLALLGTVWAGGASAAVPGEVTTYPVQPCSNLLPAAEGVLVRPCDESGDETEPAVVNILPDGSLVSRAIPAAPSNLIANGPSGELWLSLNGGGPVARESQGIERVAADGAFNTYLVPGLPGHEVIGHDLVVDGEGTAWAAIGHEDAGAFVPGTTEGGELLRISTLGTERFALPHDLDPQGLVLGPEGSLWFTAVAGRFVAEHEYDPGTGFIGRLDPAGRLAFFRIPGRGHEPGAITVGPDGRLWFTELNGGAIGTIAPDGTFGRRYPMRTWGPDGGLAFGLEGDLWMAASGGGGVMRMTPWGQQTFFPGSSSGFVPERSGDVVIGSDGDIWSRGGEDVERFVPGAPGLEVHRLTGRMSSGAIGALLACGGSPSGCEGTLEVELRTPPLYRKRHKADPAARAYRLARLPYSAPAESQTLLHIPVSVKARSLITLFRHYEIREGVPIEARATVAGGPSLRQELRAALGTRPRSSRQESSYSDSSTK